MPVLHKLHTVTKVQLELGGYLYTLWSVGLPSMSGFQSLIAEHTGCKMTCMKSRFCRFLCSELHYSKFCFTHHDWKAFAYTPVSHHFTCTSTLVMFPDLSSSAYITPSITRVILKVIRSGVGWGLGPRSLVHLIKIQCGICIYEPYDHDLVCSCFWRTCTRIRCHAFYVMSY